MVPLHILRVTLVSALFLTSVSGHCRNPRVRREWRAISSDERASWINAVKCLADLPHDPKIAASVDPALSLIPPIAPNSSHYDDFVYTHMDLNVLIHMTGLFLPWHRQYVQTFEDELRWKCGYDGVQPYWDWTQDTADFYHATIFSNSTYDGLGSWGDPKNDFQIFTGGLKDMGVAYPVPHNIRRNYTNEPFFGGWSGGPPGTTPNPTLMLNTTFTKANVDFIVSSFGGDYVSFQAYTEGIAGVHPGAHLILGGDMGGRCPFGLEPPVCNLGIGMKWSSNDPMFFLHHTMIDKVWYDWQHWNSSNAKAFGGGSESWQTNTNVSFLQYPTGGPPPLSLDSVIPGDGFWEDVTIGDVMDTVGGRLCYVYG